MIYFDSAATTFQKPPSVHRAAAEAMSQMSSPGRGSYPPAARASETLLAMREEAGRLFDVTDPERVILTFNATHALNIAVQSVAKPGGTILLSGFEHNAVTRPLAAIPDLTVKTIQSPLFRPDIFMERLDEELTPEVDGVILTHMSNVFGYILPVEEAATLCRKRGVPLVVDASQSAGVLPVKLEGWGAEFVGLPGHKGLYGPQGTGLLLCRKTGQPILMGGTGSASRLDHMPDFLPDRLEAGTHNMPGAAGLLAGMKFVRRKGPDQLLRHETHLKDVAGEALSRLPGLQVFYKRKKGVQGGVLSFRAINRDPGHTADFLGRNGVAVRAGLHCSPLAHTTAGTDAAGTVRVSFSAFNTQREVEQFINLMRRYVST